MSVFRFMTLLAGVGSIGYGAMREVYQEFGGDDPQVQVALNDPGVRYELKKILYEELMEHDQVLNEREAREGRNRWEQEERLEYEQIRRLEGKFEYLHKDNPDLVASYRDPQMRLESYRGLVDLMKQEFRHSSLPHEFARACIGSSAEVLGRMEPQAAKELYVRFSEDLMRTIGVRAVRDLADNLTKKLPVDHPVVQEIQKDGWLGEEVYEWLKTSKENSAIFDQNEGEILVFHHKGGKKILLDVFPGNGGPPDGVAWERGMPAHIAVRTPDGNFTFDRAFEKKSPSWQFSWVADTAELRWAEDSENVDYKDQDGKWRRLTGEDAEFVVYGAPQKPFKEKMASSLYKAVSKEKPDGSWSRPGSFSYADALGLDGKLRSIWDMNDFGSQSIRMTDGDGELMSIYFHSSPDDEAPNEFLNYSHGCIHMKPHDLEAMADYLKRGSDIRISSFEEIIGSVQFEKPGSDIPG
ncbi:MAG: L,D-transpeptidase [Candidatus Uhrbacteria bacterium]|nr:L,D-transpeptidase [Candidatus Uhrbacteria bacterium]